MIRLTEKALVRLASSLMVAAAASVFMWWAGSGPSKDFELRNPGDGESMRTNTAVSETIQIGESFAAREGQPSLSPGDWPAFRGAGRDNIARGEVDLARQWSPEGPPRLWQISAGDGHAGPAVWKGRVYLLDYDETKKADTLRCLSLDDGREIWRRWYKVRVKRNHGMSRTVPAVNDHVVVTMGPRCHVMAVDPVTGDFRWGMDLEKDYGTKTPFWYTGQCPLLDNDTVVLAPAGRVLMTGVEAATGRVLWETPNPKGWQMSHVSVMPMTLAGRRMYVYSAIGGMAAVAAEGPDTGRVLWETGLWSQSVLAPSPVIMPDGRIFLTAGYGAGSMVLQVTAAGDTFQVRKLQEFKPEQGLASEQQTPLYWQGHLFGIQPKDAGMLNSQFVCYQPSDCTKLVWSSGQAERFGLGPYLLAGNSCFVLNDDGVLTLLELSAAGYRRLARARVMDGHDAWGPMALAGGRLLLRDLRQLICLDVSATGATGR